MTQAQETMVLFRTGDKDAAYQLFLADETGNGCDFSFFCAAMERMIARHDENERSEMRHAEIMQSW